MADDANEHVHSFPFRLGRPMRPEEGLAVAVLANAVGTLKHYAVAENGAGRRVYAEVDEWFACDDTNHPFTFVAICDLLALDVAYLRSGLRRWRRRGQVARPTELRILPRPDTSRVPTRVAAAGSLLPPAPTH